MVISRVDEPVRLPPYEDALLGNDPKKIVQYLILLVRTLQGILEQLAEVTNLGVDLNDGDASYLGSKNELGVYPIGTFRWIKIDEAVELQEKVTDTGVDDDDWIKVASHSR